MRERKKMIDQAKFNALAWELARWVLADELRHGPGFEQSTIDAAKRVLAEAECLLADQPAATETACSCICDGACGCPCHDNEPGIDERRKAKVAPQGAPDEGHAGS